MSLTICRKRSLESRSQKIERTDCAGRSGRPKRNQVREEQQKLTGRGRNKGNDRDHHVGRAARWRSPRGLPNTEFCNSCSETNGSSTESFCLMVAPISGARPIHSLTGPAITVTARPRRRPPSDDDDAGDPGRDAMVPSRSSPAGQGQGDDGRDDGAAEWRARHIKSRRTAAGICRPWPPAPRKSTGCRRSRPGAVS